MNSIALSRVRMWCVIAVAVAMPLSVARAVPTPTVRRPDAPAARTPATTFSPVQLDTGERMTLGSGVVADTGADTCFDAQVIAVPVGPLGSPATVTITGDNSVATGPDCDQTGTQPVWWEAFELAECATVRIDFCGTTPVQDPSNSFMFRTCPLAGTNCGNKRFRNAEGRGVPFCSDNNAWFVFNTLDPGVYYYPVYSDPADLVNGPGPYQIQISAESCPGSCCDFDAGTCTDNAAPLDCAGPNQVFNVGQVCCTTECLPPGEEFVSSGVELLSQVPLSAFGGGIQNASDAWGYTSPSGREYAIIGLSPGTGFVEITDPFNPVVIATPADAVSLWSDMRTYQQYAYNVNLANGGVQIFDLQDIDSGTVTQVGSLTESGLQAVHNISVNEDSGFLYLSGSNLSFGTLIAVDLTDPAAPTIAGIWKEGAFLGGGAHDVQVITYTSGPYAGSEIAFVFSSSGFYIVDVTDKGNMHTRSSIVGGPFNFAHQGWITEDQRYILMGDEGGNFQHTTYVINVEDIDAPFFVTTFSTGLCTIDHNQMVRGSLTYQADYNSGLRIFDISDPTSAQPVAFFDTHPENNNYQFAGAWGVFTQFPSGLVIITDIERGLFVLNYDCNDNGLDDTDDIDTGFSDDSNGNGIPDECECGVLVAASVEPAGVDKSRYLSVVPNNGARPMGIRVKLVDLAGFPGSNGEFRWAGPPQLYPGVDGQPSFWGSALQCDPFIGDWSAVDVLHLFGREVVPGSTYEVQMLHEACSDASNDESNYTAALSVPTGIWGDIVGPFGGGGQPDFADISSVVESFQGSAGSPSKPSAQLQPSTPDPSASVSFADISIDVEAFQSVPFPFAGPGMCP